MANYQLTFYFRQTNRGWTESFYVVSNTPAQTIVNAIRSTLVAPAMAFRHTLTVMQGFRLRNLDGSRSSKVEVIEQAGPGASASTNSVDNVVTAARVTIHCNGGPDRRLWIRGLRDADTLRDGISGAPNLSSIATQISAYTLGVKVLGGCTRVQTPAPNPANVPPTLFDWQNAVALFPHATNSQWTVVRVSDGATMPAVGNFVYFRGLPNPGALYLRGRFRVVETQTTPGLAFVVPAQYRGGGSSVAMQNCQWRRSEYQYLPWTDSDTPTISAHDTGSPSIRVRGRRSPLIRRSLTRAG